MSIDLIAEVKDHHAYHSYWQKSPDSPRVQIIREDGRTKFFPVHTDDPYEISKALAWLEESTWCNVAMKSFAENIKHEGYEQVELKYTEHNHAYLIITTKGPRRFRVTWSFVKLHYLVEDIDDGESFTANVPRDVLDGINEKAGTVE